MRTPQSFGFYGLYLSIYQSEIKTEKIYVFNLKMINLLYVNTAICFMKNNYIFQNKKFSGKSGIILHFWKALLYLD